MCAGVSVCVCVYDRKGCLGHDTLGCVGVIPNSALSGGFGAVLTGPWTWIKKKIKGISKDTT